MKKWYVEIWMTDNGADIIRYFSSEEEANSFVSQCEKKLGMYFVIGTEKRIA